MRRFLQSPVRDASSILAIALMLVVGSSTALARQQEQPRGKTWLGVSIRDVTEKAAKENKLPDQSGAYVADVAEHSPADSAGIEERDIIVEFGRQKIDDAEGLMRAVEKSKVGDKVNVVFVRKGEKKNVQAVLARFPRRREAPFAVNNLLRRIRIIGNRADQGMELMELNDQLGEYFGVSSGTGILVEKVIKGGAAEKAGIKAGDVLLKVGKRTIDDLEDVGKAFSKLDEGDKVDIEILRKGSEKTLSLEVEEDDDGPSFEIFRHGSSGRELYHMPPYEEYHFNVPRWEGQFDRIGLPDFKPDMKAFERDLKEMGRSLREHQKGIKEGLRTLQLRAV